MLRMDSGSKCTWYKFIKGEQRQSYCDADRQRGKTVGCSCSAKLLKSTLAIIIFLLVLHLQRCYLRRKKKVWFYVCIFFPANSSFFNSYSAAQCACGETRRVEKCFNPTLKCLAALKTDRPVLCLKSPTVWFQHCIVNLYRRWYKYHPIMDFECKSKKTPSPGLVLKILDPRIGIILRDVSAVLQCADRWAVFGCKLNSEPEICLRRAESPETRMCSKPTVCTTAQLCHPVRTKTGECVHRNEFH